MQVRELCDFRPGPKIVVDECSVSLIPVDQTLLPIPRSALFPDPPITQTLTTHCSSRHLSVSTWSIESISHEIPIPIMAAGAHFQYQIDPLLPMQETEYQVSGFGIACCPIDPCDPFIWSSSDFQL